MSFTPVPLSQRDLQWKDEKLGFDNAITIGTDGCTLTCLTMLVNGYGFNETPSTMNKKLKEMGNGNGFLGGLIVWGGLTRAFPGIVYRNTIICRDQPAPIDAINFSLDSGQPLVVEVDRSPSPGLQNHWVVLTARQGDDYLTLDPWPQPPDKTPVSLAGRFSFGRPLSQVITAVVWYESTAQAPVPPTPPPGNGLLVRVQASLSAGLRLRSTPSTSASTVTLEAPGTLLRCLEPDAVVLAKIGVNDQWLNVRDPGGATGYIAAWFVDKVGDGSPTPAPNPIPQPPAAGGLAVLVSQSVGAAGLRMRSQANAISSTVTILQAGAELTVIEPEAQARLKIGQQNQWLSVHDGSGNAGYVAAWYVELKPDSGFPAAGGPPASSSGSQATIPPALIDPSSPASLMVVVSSQATVGLRLRDLPNASAATLKILPAGAVLAVQETASTALAKIGVLDQWLNVKEPGGKAGYVAAWYVQKEYAG
jgi:hypothetical protein